MKNKNKKSKEIMSETKKTKGLFPVIAALIGNCFVAIIKFVAFIFSGSGALFSESIHSFADTINQILLIIGIRRSVKKADKDFAYGYGQERFLWALISACGVFFIGAGVTVYHGITSLITHEEVHINQYVFIILFVSLAIEATTFALGIREVREHHKRGSLLSILKKSDPSTLAVVYEDGVAILGILIAFTSIIITSVTHQPYWDAIGSITIGLLLGMVAILLINKNREFLIKKSIPSDLKTKIVKMLEKEPSVEKVMDFKSSIIDIDQYLIKCEIAFNGNALLKAAHNRKTLKKEFSEIKNNYDEFLKFYVRHANQIPRLIGAEIDKIELKIKKRFPEIQHIDIEVD